MELLSVYISDEQCIKYRDRRMVREERASHLEGRVEKHNGRECGCIWSISKISILKLCVWGREIERLSGE